MKSVKNICCIGAGYVGGPTMAVIADHCPSIQINVVDINKERIKAWNSTNLKDLPVYEEGLNSIIERTRGINLNFSTNVESAISTADIIFISVNTPTKKRGIGVGEASDLTWIEKCARQIAKYSVGETIVVEKSTVPVKTAEVIKTILNSYCSTNNSEKNNKVFSVLSNPEFLAEGTAINDLENPDRVLIGGEDSNSIEALANIYKSWVEDSKIIRTNIWSSELSKLIANAFLAQRISSINSISALCEATGAEIRDVAKAIGADARIGDKFLKAGPGFGGSCFQKDILNLVYLCKHFYLYEIAEYWEGVIKINNLQKHRISKLIVKKLFGNLSNKKIAILGFAFKSGTNDMRESPAIQIVKDLLNESAEINIHDPKVNSLDISRELGMRNIESFEKKEYKNEKGSWLFFKDIEEALLNVDAVVILTDWEEYFDIDWETFSSKMNKPAWIFDTRSIVEFDEIKRVGLNYWRVGDGFNLES